MNEQKKDTRIVYGATCMWWDDIYQVGTAGGTMTIRKGRAVNVNLPICPKCGGLLMEAPNMKVWMDAAKEVESKNHTGYVKFIKWNRGKCFKSRSEAIATYVQDTGEFVDNIHTIGKEQ